MNITPQHFRWHLKKTARSAMAHGASWTGLKRITYPSSKGAARIRVLTYHSFLGTRRDPFSVSPEIFERQMDYLAKHELTVSLDHLVALMRGENPIRGDRILITIDDGFKSLYSHALPILRNYAIPAIAFVTPSEIGLGCKPSHLLTDTRSEPRLTPEELLKLAAAGIVIGSHSWTHRSMGQLSIDEARNEALHSRLALESHLERPVNVYAYPFGTRADFNPYTKRVLEESGYRYGFTSQHGTVTAGVEPFELSRVKIEGGEGLRMFRLIISGGLDHWRFIDQALWRFQSTSGLST